MKRGNTDAWHPLESTRADGSTPDNHVVAPGGVVLAQHVVRVDRRHQRVKAGQEARRKRDVELDRGGAPGDRWSVTGVRTSTTSSPPNALSTDAASRTSTEPLTGTFPRFWMTSLTFSLRRATPAASVGSTSSAARSICASIAASGTPAASDGEPSGATTRRRAGSRRRPPAASPACRPSRSSSHRGRPSATSSPTRPPRPPHRARRRGRARGARSSGRRPAAPRRSSRQRSPARRAGCPA